MLAENDSTNKSAKYFADWAGDFAEWQISPDDVDEADRDADFTRDDDDAADFDAARWPEFLNA